MAEAAHVQCAAAVRLLSTLVKGLPDHVPLASTESRISEIFKKVPEPLPSADPDEHWTTFNRRMDLLYGNDVRGADGKLLNITRGPLGMDLVVGYIQSAVDAGHLLWEAALPKFARLVTGVQNISKDPPVRTKTPPRMTIEEVNDEEAPAPMIQKSQHTKAKTSTSKESVPGKSSAKRKKTTASGVDIWADTLSADDADYILPKRSRIEEDSESEVFDSNNEEIISTTERGKGLKERSKKRAARGAEQRDTETTRLGKNKVISIDSGSESDGQSAQHKVDTEEAREQAKGARRGPSNASMQHFHEPVAVMDKKKGARWEFKCRYSVHSVRSVERTVKGPKVSFDDEGKLPKLNNLATHSNECRGKSKPQERSDEGNGTEQSTAEGLNLKRSADLMRNYLKDGELNPEALTTERGFLRLFAAWILDEDLPWTTGEAPSLRLLFKYLKVRYMLPSDTTVRNQLAKIFAELNAKVVKSFTSVKSKIAYAEDTWTTKQMVYTFACTIGSFIDDDWRLVEMVVDFKPLEEKEHEGEYAGQAFVNGVRERGGLNKCISLTTDNASVNDVLVATVARCVLACYGVEWNPDGHIRCIAHVINLTVQDLLASMDEAEWSSNVDYYELNKDAPFHYSVDEDVEQIALEAEGDSEQVDGEEDVEIGTAIQKEEAKKKKAESKQQCEESEQTVAESMKGTSALRRLRFITTKIVSSPQRRQKFRRIAHSKYSEQTEENARRRNLMVVRDVRTRWNYTHAMIRRAQLLQEAIDTWTFETEEMRPLLIEKKEWKLLEDLADILEPFTHVTLIMSRTSQLTIPFVLPAYHQLDTHLEAKSTETSLPKILTNAASVGLEKLRKYKRLADGNRFYVLGTVLHPGMRSKWFETLGTTSWEREDHRDKAETMFRHVALDYFQEQLTSPTPDQSSLNKPKPPANGFLSQMCAVDLSFIPTSPQATQADLEDEISRYLRFEGGVGKTQEPLEWWQKHAGSFPTIARMARDFLGIPATSVSVERTFSKSRHICSDLRGSLKAETIQKALLAKVWIRSGLLDVNEPVKPRKKHGSVDRVTQK